MLVELCILLRMVMHEGHHLALDRYEIISCDDSKELVRENTVKEFTERPAREEPQLNYLWAHNPMAQMMLPRPDLDLTRFWSRPAIFRKPALSLTKLSKSLQNDFSPSFKKSHFEFERRNKPITLVAFRNPRNGPNHLKAMHKMSGDFESEDVAEMQSPYNDVSAFWQEDRIA